MVRKFSFSLALVAVAMLGLVDVASAQVNIHVGGGYRSRIVLPQQQVDQIVVPVQSYAQPVQLQAVQAPACATGTCQVQQQLQAPLVQQYAPQQFQQVQQRTVIQTQTYAQPQLAIVQPQFVQQTAGYVGGVGLGLNPFLGVGRFGVNPLLDVGIGRRFEFRRRIR